MNQWAFVLAAYLVVGLAVAGLVLWAWASMRSAEAEVEASKHRS